MHTGAQNAPEPIAPLLSQLHPTEQGTTFSGHSPFSTVVDIIHSSGIWMHERYIPDLSGCFLHLPNTPSLPWAPPVTMPRNDSELSHRGTQGSKSLSHSQRNPDARRKEESLTNRVHSAPRPGAGTTDSDPQLSSSTGNSKCSRGRGPNLIGPDPNVGWTIYHECPPSMENIGFEGASNFMILGGNWGVHHGSVNHYTVLGDGTAVRSGRKPDEGVRKKRKQRRRGSN